LTGLDVDGITAQVLNDHYAATSADRDYQKSVLKFTAPDQHYSPSSTLFLRLGAPLFSAPLAPLFN